MTPATNVRIEHLIRVTSQLVDVMNREIALLRAMRVGEIGALQKEKRELTFQYEDAVATMAAEPELLRATEPALRTELEAVAAQFDAAVNDNARALNAVRESHERLLRAMVDAVTEQQSRQKAYTADGALDNPRCGRRVPVVSLAVDQRL